MKTLNLFKFNARWMMAIIAMLTIGVEQMWAAVGDVTTLIDFTQTGNWGHSAYNDTWTLSANHNSSGNIACEAAYATSNNEAIIRFGGGKNALITNQLSYIGTKSATSVPVSTFKVNVTTVTSSANLTINSVKLYVYSDASYTSQLDCVDKTSSYTSTGEISFTPTSGSAWASGVYFKLVWDLSTIATGSNLYTAINKLQIVEGATNVTLTYHANGATSGSVPVDASSPYAPSSTVTVKANTGDLARTGCTFAGWNTAADGSGTTYAAGETFTISANTTLYAKWAATVTWNDNGGVIRTDNIFVPAAGKSVTPPSDPSTSARGNCGDKFMGWTTTADYKGDTPPGVLVNGAQTITGSADYYAVFADYAE